MTDFVQWEGFPGPASGKKKSTPAILSRRTTAPTPAMKASLPAPPKQPISFGVLCRFCRKEERAKGGVLDMETEVVSGMTAYGPGYISEDLKDLEKVVGLQTDKPLKARLHALWRHQDGRTGLHHLWLYSVPEAARNLYQVCPHPQHRCV